MAVQPDLKRFQNKTGGGFTPIPDIPVAPLPDKLQKIDPDGCKKWEQEQRRLNAEWAKTLNTLQNTVQDLIKTKSS